MTNGYIGIDEPATIDKRADTEELTVGGVAVHRERIQIAGAVDVALATVGNSIPASDAYGLTTREARTNQVTSGALGALNAAITLDAQAGGSFGFEIDTGTLSGTVRAEGTKDDTNWYFLDLLLSDGTIATAVTNGNWRGQIMPLGGESQVRLRVTAYTSGTSNARLEVSPVATMVQVSRVASLPALAAGSNNIGDVDVLSIAAGDNNIGNVDVVSGPTGASALQMQGTAAADAAVVGNPSVVAGRASAAAPADVSADGDVVPAWHLRNGAQATVLTAAGALVGGDATNGLDVDVTRLPALAAGTNNIGDVDVASVPAPLSTAGGGTEATALRVTLANDSTGLISVDDNGGSLTVDGSVTADTELPAAAALADNAANPTAPAVGAFEMVWDGATWDRQPGNSTDGALVNLGANNDVTVTSIAAGNNNIGDVDVASIAAGDNNIGNVDIVTGPTGANALQVQGTVAHDSAAAQNPVPMGAVAETPDDSAPGNQVSAEADVVRVASDRDGAIYTHPHPPRIWHVASEYTTAQTDTSLKAAPGAGLSLYITDIYIACNAAVTVTIEESTTTLKFRYYAAGQGDGVSKQFAVPIKITANTAITVTTSGAVTVTVVVCGYTAP